MIYWLRSRSTLTSIVHRPLWATCCDAFLRLWHSDVPLWIDTLVCA